MKKLISILILVCFINSFIFEMPVFADPFEGHAEVTDQKNQTPSDIFTGDTETMETKDVINMTVSQVLSAGISEEGDEFFAEVTNEVLGEKGVLLPLGTIAHGSIRSLGESKRLGRDGWIELSFDSLITPDGREIPIEGKMTTKLHPVTAVAKTVATDAGYTLVGGVVGGFTALNVLGLEAAIASNGYTIAGGAGVGAAIGLGMSLFRKGKDALISPGDEIKVKIQSNIKLPVISFNALKQEELDYKGLEVRVNSINLIKDPFGELNTISLNLVVENFSKTDFSSFDIALVNDLKQTYYPSIFCNENSLAFTKIKKGDRVAGALAFSVDNPKRKHWLIFYDRRTRKPLAKISLENIQREMQQKEIAKKGKKKRKS